MEHCLHLSQCCPLGPGREIALTARERTKYCIRVGSSGLNTNGSSNLNSNIIPYVDTNAGINASTNTSTNENVNSVDNIGSNEAIHRVALMKGRISGKEAKWHC
ncbi:uncharacterized protein ZBAI_05630 [Zygosaccharomyces bailii ISA1307]|nr:uncharacterized protein ZBAI_05630 [Zygosaccharomyces bailii ISA1307]